MIETLLAIIAAELGFMCAVGAAIFAMEMWSLWLRFKAMQEDSKLTKIHVSPEEMKALLSGGTLPLDKLGKAPETPVSTEAKTQQGQYL